MIVRWCFIFISHLLCPDPRRLLHGQEPPHPIGGVHQVILWRHREGGQVLQQVGGHPASWKQNFFNGDLLICGFILSSSAFLGILNRGLLKLLTRN